MSNTTDNWSRSWNSSTNPSKQRKYRDNAPLHVKDNLISANLDPELREELGTRSITVRTGDRVRIMRGDQSGISGIVTSIDRDEQRLYVDGVTVERQNGTEAEIPLRPSNVQVTALNVDDERRLEKYDVDDFAGIQVDKEEMEEAMEQDEESEMMQQMQSGDSSMDIDTGDEEDGEEEPEEDSEEEPGEEEVEEENEESGQDYGDLVSGTISDAKDQLQEMDNPDYEAALEAEKANKDRKTMKEWLETRTDE